MLWFVGIRLHYLLRLVELQFWEAGVLFNWMQPLTNAPINILPHHPPLGLQWGNSRGFDTKILPPPFPNGAFDKRPRPTMGNSKKNLIKNIFPCQIPIVDVGLTRGFDTLSLPHHRAFDIQLCQIPTIAPLSPEGGGEVVGQYIDRCIIVVT